MWVVEGLERPDLVRDVALHMRDWDRREIFATREEESVDELCFAVAHAGDYQWVAGRGGEAIAAFGCKPMWRGVFDMWLFATDNIGSIGISLTRLVRNAIVPQLFREGAHRLECRSMEGHIDAHAWLEVIGAKREATHVGYGRRGEDFHVYTWAPR